MVVDGRLNGENFFEPYPFHPHFLWKTAISTLRFLPELAVCPNDLLLVKLFSS